MQRNVNVLQMSNYSIDFHGLSLGEHYFEFKVDDDFFARYEGVIIHAGEGVVSVRLQKHSTMMELFFTISANVEVECDRCLEDFRIPVLFEGNLIVKISHEKGEYDGDVMWIDPSEDSLDLAQYIYESIVLSLPFQLVHPNIKDCNQDMINRFHIVSQEEIEAIEHAEHNTPFESLGEMKNALVEKYSAPQGQTKKSKKR